MLYYLLFQLATTERFLVLKCNWTTDGSIDTRLFGPLWFPIALQYINMYWAHEGLLIRHIIQYGTTRGVSFHTHNRFPMGFSDLSLSFTACLVYWWWLNIVPGLHLVRYMILKADINCRMTTVPVCLFPGDIYYLSKGYTSGKYMH